MTDRSHKSTPRRLRVVIQQKKENKENVYDHARTTVYKSSIRLEIRARKSNMDGTGNETTANGNGKWTRERRTDARVAVVEHGVVGTDA